MKKKSNEELIQLSETIGALQDTLIVHAEAFEKIIQNQYGVIISLDLVYMVIVSMWPGCDHFLKYSLEFKYVSFNCSIVSTEFIAATAFLT